MLHNINGRRLPWGLLVAVAALSLVLDAQGPAASREDAVRLRAKVDAITRNAALPTASPLSTRLTEREVNAYFAFDGRDAIPRGVADPHVTIVGSGRLEGTAVVDLDAVRDQRKSRGWLDPLNYLGGRVPVAVSGTLDAAGGYARFDLESARLGGVPIPKMVVQELVSFYSRTADNPRGLNIDDPYPLPARIRQIDVRRGEAVVVQ
ncbi:MAG TPA: hypothetical protein VGK32_07250 [Vicinamibacterales bacterium]|jgi:hypothetical protein